MAISRMVIIFDFERIEPPYIYKLGALVLDFGMTYWLLIKRTE